MPTTPQDERHLATALALARAATGLASPNPTVGCVIALGDIVLGEGAHRYDARDHAEIVALKQAASLGHNVRGATAYVTLEPCSHHGRTGPCADALVAAGIARCVIATVDPNPLVRGNGIAKLRAASVEVILAEGTLRDEARRLNDAFACFIRHKRPFVTLKAALSVDGKLAPPPSSRVETAPHWITGVAARTDAQTLRHEADAILTGIGTVLADNPSLTDRTGLPRRRPLLRVVLDSDLRIPLQSTLVASARNDVLVLCHHFAPGDRERELRERGIYVERLNGEACRPGLIQVLEALSFRTITSLLVEAGSQINANFLVWDLVNKLVLYYAERELGLDAVPFAADYESPYVLQQGLTHITRAAFPNAGTEDVRVAGYLHDPWSDIP
jgi:diaminohydroxyphosphoribosylaminopyrimidine deaminase/5-amino-6-(5-phosphoribosylamino)uracil reductase